jgi:hypothetical protein|tara:strand:- start:5068 stop:6297 length:1230 start_codon:yes stop_codon:yes gene_type:complete
MKLAIIFYSIFISFNLFAHGPASSISGSDSERKIIFPDLEDRITIISDLHTHSVFSDGHVWPNIRVEEAIRDGLDLIAVTEHLEYQPHIDDIPHPDRNKSFIEAKAAAKKKDIIVINGSEITRENPPGHINAVFINDANKLMSIDYEKTQEANNYIADLPEDIKETYQDESWFMDLILANLWPPIEALKEAKKQGGFTFWNHPASPDQSNKGISILSDLHREMISLDLLDGIEVVNGNWYSEEAFEIALEHDLTLIGTSDVHDLIEWDYPLKDNQHRPVTLIFSKERTAESIRVALSEDRTAIWWKNTVIAKPRNMQPLLKAAISILSADYLEETSVMEVILKNKSDVGFQLKNILKQTFQNAENIIFLPPQGEISIQINDYNKKSKHYLKFEVLNALTAPRENPIIVL